jgi:hypothetical protein
LRALAGPKKAAASRWRRARWLLAPVLCAASFFVAWIYFYGIGQILLNAFPAPVVGQ